MADEPAQKIRFDVAIQIGGFESLGPNLGNKSQKG